MSRRIFQSLFLVTWLVLALPAAQAATEYVAPLFSVESEKVWYMPSAIPERVRLGDVDADSAQLLWGGLMLRDAESLIATEDMRWRPDWKTFMTQVPLDATRETALARGSWYMWDNAAVVWVTCGSGGCRMDEVRQADVKTFRPWQGVFAQDQYRWYGGPVVLPATVDMNIATLITADTAFANGRLVQIYTTPYTGLSLYTLPAKGVPNRLTEKLYDDGVSWWRMGIGSQSDTFLPLPRIEGISTPINRLYHAINGKVYMHEKVMPELRAGEAVVSANEENYQWQSGVNYLYGERIPTELMDRLGDSIRMYINVLLLEQKPEVMQLSACRGEDMVMHPILGTRADSCGLYTIAGIHPFPKKLLEKPKPIAGGRALLAGELLVTVTFFNGNLSVEMLPVADVASLTTVNGWTAMDNQALYCFGEFVSGPVLRENRGQFQRVGDYVINKKGQDACTGDMPVTDGEPVDWATYELLYSSGRVAKDAKSLILDGRREDQVDSATAEWVGYELIRDKNGLYYISEWLGSGLQAYQQLTGDVRMVRFHLFSPLAGELAGYIFNSRQIIGKYDGGRPVVLPFFDNELVYLGNLLGKKEGADAFLRVYTAGVMRGNPDGSLGLTEALNRAQMLVLLQRAFYPEAKCQNREVIHAFRDVPRDVWYADALCLAVERGLVKGKTPELFDPGANLLVPEFFALLLRQRGESFATTGGQWYVPYMQRAHELGWTESAEINEKYIQMGRGSAFFTIGKVLEGK